MYFLENSEYLMLNVKPYPIHHKVYMAKFKKGVYFPRFSVYYGLCLVVSLS
jgi:hypothetical protein